MEFTLTDISLETYGKYQCCTKHRGLWYSDEDFSAGGGCGHLKWGAKPCPFSCQDQRPWRGEIIRFIRWLKTAMQGG